VTAKLGQRTDTSDADGEIVETKPVTATEADIKEAIKHFIGPIKQVPSMFSALKHEGKPLYFYARQGITIDRPARDITIYEIEWVSLHGDELSLNVRSSKGTYIRSLVDDLGQMLGCGAHVTVLRRTAVAQYDASQMITFEELYLLAPVDIDAQKLAGDTGQDAPLDFSKLDALLLPMDTPIEALSKVEIDSQYTLFFQQGRDIAIYNIVESRVNEEQTVRVYESGSMLFLGVATVDSTNTLHPKRVVVY
jgi:tRNA pseudouridine55 synthase